MEEYVDQYYEGSLFVIILVCQLRTKMQSGESEK